MKNQKVFFLILITIITMITGCDSTPTTIIGGGGTVSDIDFSVLEFASDISVMTPYNYNLSSIHPVGTISNSSAMNSTSLLSYSSNGFEGFKPIIAENENNQKFIFSNINIENIGDNYYLGYSDIYLISQDPIVFPNKEGEDENGNSIISSSDVYVEIERTLGSFPLIIDVNNAQIHLLRNPSTGEGLSIDIYNGKKSGYSTPNAIYLIASRYSINSGWNNNTQIYRISKKELASGIGSFVAITNLQNTDSYSSLGIISCSDSAVVGYYGDFDSESDYFLIDVSNSKPLSLLNKDDYVFDIPEINATNLSMYKINFNTLVLDGNEAHSYNLVGGKLISMNFTINNGTLIKNGYDIYDTGLGNLWSWINSISSINNERGSESVLMLTHDYDSNNHRIVRVTHYNGKFAVNFIDEKIEIDSIEQFFSIHGRTYWLENVLRVPSYICYADYELERIVRTPVKGLQISDWKINVGDDGTVTYLQFYNQNSIGMYNWNPDDTASFPKLITSYEGDVSQVFTFNV